MYETRREPLMTFTRFLLRMAAHMVAAIMLLLISLSIGVWGFMNFDALAPIDALLNSSMLLTGMGPVSDPSSDAGKLFATFYALYAGLIFLAAAGIFFAPILHRFLHHFHLEMAEEDAAHDAP
jgi:hypothetical protein